MKINKIILIVFMVGLMCGLVSAANTWNASLDAGLIVSWNMSGMLDSKNGFDLSANGGTVLYPDNATVMPNLNHAGYFDGDDDLIINEYKQLHLNHTTQDITSCFWYRTSIAGSNGILGRDDDAWVMYAGSVHNNIAVGFSGVPLEGTNNRTDDKWEYFCVNKNSTNACLWLDGNIKICQARSLITHTPQSIRVGNALGNYYTGYLDEIVFWNRSLSPKEIGSLYNDGDGMTRDGYGGAPPSTNDITVTLISPDDVSSLSVSKINFTANMTMGGNVNLTNSTVYVWFSNSTLFNSTINDSIPPVSNSSRIEISDFILETYIWNVYACGVNTTDLICNWATTNRTFEVGASINDETYPKYSLETKTERFLANISILSDVNLFAVKLIHNGTSYLADKTDLGSGKYKVERTLDMPILSGGTQNLTFYWVFEYLNSVQAKQNSSERSHQLAEFNITKTDVTYPTAFVNFTFYNETNTSTSINADFDATFNYWLGMGSVKKNYTVESSSLINSYAISPSTNISFNMSGIINLESTSFNDRNFHFNKERYLNNTITNTQLFLVDDAGTRSIIVQVRDSGLVPLENYYVKIYRYYPESNSYKIVERSKTDEYGQIVARLVEPNTVKYQFEFLDSNNIIKKRTGDMTIACRATICVIPFVIEDTVSDIERFGNVTDYDWSFEFDNDTTTFTFTWNDVSSVSATNWLKVERYLWNGTEVICNVTSTATSGTLTCDVGNIEASYQAQVFRQTGSENWRRIASLSKSVGTTYQVYGMEGLIWSFFLLMTMVAIGYWNPVVGIALYIFTSWLLYSIKIIYVNPAILIAELAIAVVFIWAFGGTKRT